MALSRHPSSFATRRLTSTNYSTTSSKLDLPVSILNNSSRPRHQSAFNTTSRPSAVRQQRLSSATILPVSLNSDLPSFLEPRQRLYQYTRKADTISPLRSSFQYQHRIRQHIASAISGVKSGATRHYSTRMSPTGT